MDEYLSPRGRSGRLRYFLVSLGAEAFILAPFIPLGLLAAGREPCRLQPAETRLVTPIIMLWGCFAVLSLWVAICNFCRRLHDLDRSGWEVLLFWVPLYNWYLGFLLMFGRGSLAENRYGLPEGKDARGCPDLRGFTATPSRPMA